MGSSRNKVVGENPVNAKAIELANIIKESEEYKRYLYYLGKIKARPELYAKVCAFRKQNFEMQNSDVEENLYDRVIRFRIENEELRKDALVNDFLRSELTVCRMMQHVNHIIMDNITLDIEFLN